FEVTQTAFRRSTVPENLNASQFRQTSGPHNTPHRTLHAAINTIASNVVPSSPPRQRSCIKQARSFDCQTKARQLPSRIPFHGGGEELFLSLAGPLSLPDRVGDLGPHPVADRRIRYLVPPAKCPAVAH